MTELAVIQGEIDNDLSRYLKAFTDASNILDPRAKTHQEGALAIHQKAFDRAYRINDPELRAEAQGNALAGMLGLTRGSFERNARKVPAEDALAIYKTVFALADKVDNADLRETVQRQASAGITKLAEAGRRAAPARAYTYG